MVLKFVGINNLSKHALIYYGYHWQLALVKLNGKTKADRPNTHLLIENEL